MLEASLREVEPGEAVRADDHNALVRAVRRLMQLVAIGEDGAVDDLFVYRGVVTAVDKPADADDCTVATVFYTVKALRRPDDCDLVEVRPINPPTKNTALVISPCEVGDFCLIVRLPDSDGTLQLPRMVQFTETVDDGLCA